MLRLRRHRGQVPFARCSLFCCCRLRVDSTLAAVIAHPVDGRVIDHSRVVDIVNVGDVNVVHRAVVIELAVVPASALVAVAEISVAVGDAAIETDLRSPIAFMK